MTSECDRNPLGSSNVATIIADVAKKLNIKDYEIEIKKNDLNRENFIGQVFHITVKPRNNGGKTLKLFLKKSAETTRIVFPLTLFFKYEINAYTKVLPALDGVQKQNNIPLDEQFLIAKFYSGSAKEYEEIMILGDLKVDGFQMHDISKPMDENHARMVLQTMARFHACSFALREKDPELFEMVKSNVPQEQNYGDKIVKAISLSIDKLAPLMQNQNIKTHLEQLGNNLEESLLKVLDSSLTEPFNVICHGDCWNNNLLFKYKDGKPSKMVMIDWQIIRYASPATDLAYFLTMAGDKDYLNGFMDTALETYFVALETALNRMGCDVAKCYPKEVFRKQVESHFVFGLMMSLIALPLFFPVNQGSTSVGDFVEDPDTKKNVTPLKDSTVERISGLIHFCIVNNFI